MVKISKEQKKKLTKLKRAGLIDIDLRKNTTTKYQLSKIYRFRDIINNTANSVEISKEQKKQFRKAGGFEIFGNHLIIRSTVPYEKLTNKNGLIKAVSLLKNGNVTKIILPYSAKNILELVEKIEKDENLPNYIDTQDGDLAQYAFSIAGHQSLHPFPSKKALVDYVKGYYNHLFKTDQSIINFSLMYFNSGDSELPELPKKLTGEKIYSSAGEGRKYSQANASGRNYVDPAKRKRRLEGDKMRKKKERKKLTDEQRKIYNQKGRKRATKSNNSKRDKTHK